MQVASEYAIPGYAGFSAVSNRAVPSEVLYISPPVRWAFYAFVFSILFESAPIGIPVEVTAITGGLLVAAIFFIQPRIYFQPLPPALWCFVIYFLIGNVIVFAKHSLFDQEVLSRQFKFLQLLFLFWIAYTLMRHQRAAKGGLLSLIASCAVLSLLQNFGLTTTTEGAVSRLDRLTAFGLDSNQLAGVLALGLVSTVGFAYIAKRKASQLLVLSVVMLVGVGIVKTGSRGGLLALGVGLLVFALGKGTLFTKVRNVLLVVVMFGVLGVIAYQSDLVRHRFEVAVEDGNMSEREKFYPICLQMIQDSPLIGWGPVLNTIELGNRAQLLRFDRLDPHNLVFYILTATGIVGGVPFFTGVWLCVRQAWKSRSAGSHGMLPFALTATLLTSELSVTGFHWKHHWLILAYALASGSHLIAVKRNTIASHHSLEWLPQTL